MARKLTVVTPDTKAPAKKRTAPATIKEAVEGSERDLLVAMRRKAAAEIDAGVPAHALAPLMRQMRELDKEIRALDARDEQEGSDRGPTEDEAWSAV
jgi:hypothetical protein